MVARSYVPDRGDVIWVSFNPQSGHEQAGHRPALVLSALEYNKRVGLLICCPITRHIKGYPFEVPVPEHPGLAGAILADQVRSLDWKSRRAEFFTKLPAETLEDVISRLQTLISPE